MKKATKVNDSPEVVEDKPEQEEIKTEVKKEDAKPVAPSKKIDSNTKAIALEILKGIYASNGIPNKEMPYPHDVKDPFDYYINHKDTDAKMRRVAQVAIKQAVIFEEML